MTTEQMTVHEALAELKMLDNRIDKKINDASFACANKASNKKICGKPVADYIADADRDYQSVCDLIRRRAAIRNALSKSNAETRVEIDGVNYSVSEAIEMKRSGIQLWKELLLQIQTQYGMAKSECGRNNMRLDAEADKQVAAVYGTKEKVTTDDAMAMRKAIIEAGTMEPITLPAIDDRINEIQYRIDKFVVAVDSKLSISNALTVINIEY